jgi:hypothetical protein
LQAATDRVACAAAPHQHLPPPPATRRSPQGAAPRHGEGGQRRRRTAAPRHTTRPPPTTTGRRKGGYPVVSNRPIHRAMQQRCHHVSHSICFPLSSSPHAHSFVLGTVVTSSSSFSTLFTRVNAAHGIVAVLARVLWGRVASEVYRGNICCRGWPAGGTSRLGALPKVRYPKRRGPIGVTPT